MHDQRKRRRSTLLKNFSLAAVIASSVLHVSPAFARRDVSPLSQTITSASSTPVIIHDPSQALAIIAKGGPIIYLANEHLDQASHQVAADLMPVLATAHVTCVAVELPIKLQSFYSALQEEIRQQHLSVAEVSKRLQTKYAEENIVITGGISTIDDDASILVAATAAHIAYVAIDNRQDEAFAQRLNEDFAHGTLHDALNLAFSRDQENADRTLQLLSAQKPGDRVAVIMGILHGCVGTDNPPRFIDYLLQHVPVTIIALNNRDPLRPDALTCPQLPTIGVDIGAFLYNAPSVHGQTAARAIPPASSLSRASTPSVPKVADVQGYRVQVYSAAKYDGPR